MTYYGIEDLSFTLTWPQTPIGYKVVLPCHLSMNLNVSEKFTFKQTTAYMVCSVDPNIRTIGIWQPAQVQACKSHPLNILQILVRESYLHLQENISKNKNMYFLIFFLI